MAVKFDKNGANNAHNSTDVRLRSAMTWFARVGNDSCRESCTAKSDSERQHL